MEEFSFYNTSPKIPNIPSTIRNNVSVYLLEDSSQVEQLEKQLLVERVSYVEESSSLDMSAGWMEVSHPKYISGLQYLGLFNHGNLTGTNVVLDVIAVCKKRSVSVNDWNEALLKRLEEEFVESLDDYSGMKSKEKVVDCMLSKIQRGISYNEYSYQTNSSKELLVKENIQRCIQEISSESIDSSNVLNPYQMVGKWKTEKGEVLQFLISQKISIKKKTGETMEGIWYLHDQSLIVEFENFKTQKYQPVIISPDKYVWKNRLTGNYLRYQKLIKP